MGWVLPLVVSCIVTGTSSFKMYIFKERVEEIVSAYGNKCPQFLRLIHACVKDVIIMLHVDELLQGKIKR